MYLLRKHRPSMIGARAETPELSTQRQRWPRRIRTQQPAQPRRKGAWVHIGRLAHLPAFAWGSFGGSRRTSRIDSTPRDATISGVIERQGH
jgi:hypothetical protein